MAKVDVFGAGEDLIEVRGDLVAEFNPQGNDPNYLGFSDGTVITVIYDTDDAVWRIAPVTKGTAELTITTPPDPEEDYTDYAHLTGDISWVLYGIDLVRA
jgi:hypothetical protein